MHIPLNAEFHNPVMFQLHNKIAILSIILSDYYKKNTIWKSLTTFPFYSWKPSHVFLFCNIKLQTSNSFKHWITIIYHNLIISFN